MIKTISYNLGPVLDIHDYGSCFASPKFPDTELKLASFSPEFL